MGNININIIGIMRATAIFDLLLNRSKRGKKRKNKKQKTKNRKKKKKRKKGKNILLPG